MKNPRSTLPPGLPRRSYLIVAVSGGSDSLALLHLLAELRPFLFKDIIAAHVNYGLRGKDSLADETLVRKFCARLKVSLKVLRVPGFKKKVIADKLSLQDEARRIRYVFFARLVQKEKAWGVAVAHHLEDQAETVLDRFLRGAGAKGLSGLRSLQVLKPIPGKSLRVWRPLLTHTKEELQDYLRSHHIRWREDRSNRKLDYRRNQIRHQVVPFLQKWNPRLIESLGRMGEVTAAEDEFLDQWVAKVGAELKSCWTLKKFVCSQKMFLDQPLVFRRRWIRQVAEKLVPDARGLSFERVELILRLWQGEERGPRDVGYGLSAGLTKGELFLKNIGLSSRAVRHSR